MGNTVIVVEHDEDAIRTADHVIDMGPGAGVHGGHIIAEGTPAEIIANKKSLTGKYLSRRRRTFPFRRERRKAVHNRWLKVVGRARQQSQECHRRRFRWARFTCVTGVSGGGKSTLTIETLYKAAARKLSQAREHPAPHDRIEGLEFLDKVIDIDQSPDRPHAAFQSGHLYRRLHAHPRLVRRTAGIQGARLCAGPLLASTSRAAAAKPARATA